MQRTFEINYLIFFVDIHTWRYKILSLSNYIQKTPLGICKFGMIWYIFLYSYTYSVHLSQCNLWSPLSGGCLEEIIRNNCSIFSINVSKSVKRFSVYNKEYFTFTCISNKTIYLIIKNIYINSFFLHLLILCGLKL